tara:strand:- start:7967 stop:8959 length:993 start_codon:yes stop_codon:yes gene_type:complete
MKKYHILTCLLSCLFIISCATTSDEANKPQWIENANEGYPDNEYLTAVGQASQPDRASTNAKVNLAEIFYSDIRNGTNTITEASKQDSAIGISIQSAAYLQRSIQTKTEQIINGVMIKESWLSPSGEYYALAILEKNKVAMSLNQSIRELDQSSANFIDYSNNLAPTQLASLIALRTARDEQMTRYLTNLQLKQVSVSDVPVEISSNAIESLIAKKLAMMKIAVNGDNQANKQSVHSALSELGVNVTNGADIVITVNNEVSNPDFINGWHWLQSSLQLSISEKGQVISRKDWQIKVSAKQQHLLYSRLQDKIENKMTQYITALLSDSPSL